MGGGGGGGGGLGGGVLGGAPGGGGGRGGRFLGGRGVGHLRTVGYAAHVGSLEVGWWLRGFSQASSTVLVQRARHRHVACVACVLGLSRPVVLAAARRPPRPARLGDFPRKDALDAQLPRMCVCVCVCGCVCVCVCVCAMYY